MQLPDSETRRFNLKLPPDELEQVRALALERGSSMNGLLRSFIKLGLLVDSVQKDPDATLLIRKGEHEREVIVL